MTTSGCDIDNGDNHDSTDRVATQINPALNQAGSSSAINSVAPRRPSSLTEIAQNVIKISQAREAGPSTLERSRFTLEQPDVHLISRPASQLDEHQSTAPYASTTPHRNLKRQRSGTGDASGSHTRSTSHLDALPTLVPAIGLSGSGLYSHTASAVPEPDLGGQGEIVMDAPPSAPSSPITTSTSHPKKKRKKATSVAKPVQKTPMSKPRARSARGAARGKPRMTARSDLVPRAATTPAALGPLPEEFLFPIERVMAFDSKSSLFSAATVVSIKPDTVVIRYDDEEENDCSLEQLRRCELVQGDKVRYIGSDVTIEESQLTDIREPKRVLTIQRAAGDDVEESAPLRSKDAVWVCRETDYLRWKRGQIRFEEVQNTSLLQVEALAVESDDPRKHLGLADRRLGSEVEQAFRELMTAHSGVGMRTRACPKPVLTRARSSAARVKPVLELFGLIVTSVDKTIKSQIEHEIEEQGGHLLNEMEEICIIESEDVDCAPRQKKGKAKARLDNAACQTFRLSRVKKHENLKTILLVAEMPTKTFKYMMALALGIPCVSSKWVTHSSEKVSSTFWVPLELQLSLLLFCTIKKLSLLRWSGHAFYV